MYLVAYSSKIKQGGLGYYIEQSMESLHAALKKNLEQIQRSKT